MYPPAASRFFSLLILAWLSSACALDAHPASGEGMPPDEIDGPSAVLEPGPAATPDDAAETDPAEPATTEPGRSGEASEPAPIREVPLDPIVAATYAGWDARADEDADIPPLGARCDTYLDGIEVVAADHSTFRALCAACATSDPDPTCGERGRAHACAPWASARPGETPRALVVLDPDAAATPARTALVIHETIHHLGWCTGLGTDSLHQLDALWCHGAAAGCERTVQARARRLLGG